MVGIHRIPVPIPTRSHTCAPSAENPTLRVNWSTSPSCPRVRLTNCPVAICPTQMSNVPSRSETAVVRVLLQGLLDEQPRSGVQDGLHHVDVGAARKPPHLSQQLVKHDPKAEDVGARIDKAPVRLLGRQGECPPRGRLPARRKSGPAAPQFGGGGASLAAPTPPALSRR